MGSRVIDWIEENCVVTDDCPWEWTPIFILPTGRVIDIKKTLDVGFATHMMFEQHLSELGVIPRMIGDDFYLTSECGCIRCNHNNSRETVVELPRHSINSRMYDSLIDFLDCRSKVTHIVTYDGKQHKIYNSSDTTTDDIINRIKRYYSSGILYENLREGNMTEKHYLVDLHIEARCDLGELEDYNYDIKDEIIDNAWENYLKDEVVEAIKSIDGIEYVDADVFSDGGVIYIDSTIDSKDKIEQLIDGVFSTMEKFVWSYELSLGNYHWVTYDYGLDNNPTSYEPDYEEVDFDIYTEIYVNKVVETDEQGNELKEATGAEIRERDGDLKNSLKDRAKYHSKFQKGLSPFCSLGESSDNSNKICLDGMKLIDVYKTIRRATFDAEPGDSLAVKYKDSAYGGNRECRMTQSYTPGQWKYMDGKHRGWYTTENACMFLSYTARDHRDSYLEITKKDKRAETLTELKEECGEEGSLNEGGMSLTNGFREDESMYFEDETNCYHFFSKNNWSPSLTPEYAVLVVDYGLRFRDKDRYIDSKTDMEVIPVDVAFDKPKVINYFEFTEEDRPEIIDAMMDNDMKRFMDAVVKASKETMKLGEDLSVITEDVLPEKNKLVSALKTFDSNGKVSNRGSWKIANGGYDLSFEVYYNGVPVAQCMTDNMLKITYDTSEFGFSKKELATAICSVYNDITYEDETEMNEGIWAYQTVIDRRPGEKQPSKTLTYGGNFVMSRSPYRKEQFGADWKRHIKKIIEWSTENNPGLHRLTHDYRLNNFGKDCDSEEAYISAIEHLIKRGDYVLLNESLSEGVSNDASPKFKEGDVLEYSGLFGGQYITRVDKISPSGRKMWVTTSWTMEESGEEVSEKDTFFITQDEQGNDCIEIWYYQGEVGRVYPPKNDTVGGSTAKMDEGKNKKKKPYDSINYNVGNMEHNINMFNKANSPAEGPCNNPISGPFGGDVSCCESLNENSDKPTTRYYKFRVFGTYEVCTGIDEDDTIQINTFDAEDIAMECAYDDLDRICGNIWLRDASKPFPECRVLDEDVYRQQVIFDVLLITDTDNAEAVEASVSKAISSREYTHSNKEKVNTNVGNVEIMVDTFITFRLDEFGACDANGEYLDEDLGETEPVGNVESDTTSHSGKTTEPRLAEPQDDDFDLFMRGI